MKVGSAVVMHVAVLGIFALTQGCVTTESQGSIRGAGARHKGPWKHDHKGKATASDVIYTPAPNMGQNDEMGSLIDAPMIDVTPMPQVEPAFEPMTERYIVQKGDMLSKLAIEFDTTVKTLVSMNNLSNPDVLYVGQELRVPAGRGGKKNMVKKSASSVKAGGTYVIQKGDTLSEIALAAKVSIDDLRSLNGIKNDQIFAGNELLIPDYGDPQAISRKAKKKKKAAPAPVQEQVEPAPAPVVAAPAPAPIAVDPEVVPVETTTVDMVQDHVVYPGESLDDIARQHGASKSEIMRMNGITDETAIRDGQRLRIPIAE